MEGRFAYCILALTEREKKYIFKFTAVQPDLQLEENRIKTAGMPPMPLQS